MKKNLYLIVLLSVVCLFSAIAQDKATGLSNVKLFLDPGHSLKENMGIHNYSEAEKTLRVAQAVKEYLITYTDMQEENIILCRNDDNTLVSLTERTDMANSWGADFYYSMHSDAGDPSSTSTLFLYGGRRISSGTEPIEKLPEGGKGYGDILAPNLTGVMRTGTRGNINDLVFYNYSSTRPYLHVNRESSMASHLSEAAFHTNSMQNMRNMNTEWKRLQAYAAYQSLVKFLSSKYGSAPTEPVQIGIATGFITDGETNLPINGAKITIKEGENVKTYTTDTYESLFNKYSKKPDELRNGFYWIEKWTPGATVDITVEADGFETKQEQLKIPATIGATTQDGLGIKDFQLLNLLPAVVSDVNPIDWANVPSEKPITITFSRKMDRASVESAISILPDASLAYSWTNDFTLKIDISKLDYETDYVLTIDGSVAKNTVTEDLLDGDADGVSGGDYVMSFTTAEQDLTKPEVVSYDPADGSKPEELRPIIRIQFSEPLDTETIAPNQITVWDSNNETVGGEQKYMEVNGVSVIHYLFSDDLTPNETYTVKLNKGALADRFGNEIDIPETGLNFSFTSNPREVTLVALIDDFNNGTGGWPTDPKANSGTTIGVISDFTKVGASAETAIAGSTGSMRLSYQWDAEAASYIIRFTKSSNTPQFKQDPANTMQIYVFGDASNSRLRLTVRPGGSGTIWSCKPITVDWAGWKLISWNPCVAEEGEVWLAGDVMPTAGTNVNFACFGLHGATDISYEPSFILFDNLQIVQVGDYINTSIPNVVKSKDINVTTIGKNIQVTASQAISDIRIYSVTGALINAIQPGNTSCLIPVNNLVPGVYIVKVAAGNSQMNAKVIVK